MPKSKAGKQVGDPIDIGRWAALGQPNMTSWMCFRTEDPARIHIGVLGNTVADTVAAKKLPFLKTMVKDDFSAAVPASNQEITAEFNRVFGTGVGLNAIAYRATSAPWIEIPLDQLKVSLNAGAKDLVRTITTLIPGWVTLPLSAQLAIVDIIWSEGLTGLASFGPMIAQVNAGRYDLAAPLTFRSNPVVVACTGRNASVAATMLAAQTEV